MCGINVIIGSNQEKQIDLMMKATMHRGPDHSSSCKVKEGLYFAGNRLKILDLGPASNQPLWTKERDAVLVWNGALYNYQDLRNELLVLGYKFFSNSDSEVLLYWLKHFGTEGIYALKGMFALAFTNLKSNQMITARDPSGEKPLYFSHKNGNWYFSSEAKAIQKVLSESVKINSEQFSYYYYLRHTHPQQSFYKDILQFPIGTCWSFNLNSGEKKSFTWLPKANLKRKANAGIFQELLKDAVLKNFHVERPVGLMLSGGADSSLIYSLWYEETGEPLPAYTITYPKEIQYKYADPGFVRQLAKRYPMLNRPVEITLEKVKANWDAYIKSMDQPVGDSAGFLTWILAKEASADIKVLISGAGADELFGGYNRHIAFSKYLEKPRFWEKLKQMGLGNILPSNASKFLNSIEKNPHDTFIQMAALEKIPGKLLLELGNYYPKSEGDLKNALEWDRTWYLVNDILKIHDNTCMAHGVEGRAPYLDSELIALSQEMSETEHRDQLGKKWIKSALQKRGLGAISKRKKLGFGLPLAEWMQEKDFSSWIFGTIQNMEKEWGSHFPTEMRNLALNPGKAKGRQFLQVWNLFLLASWLKQH
ncbi:asparagine synthase (glutamine-hydrolyzing) [Cecembia sp.]|uniref:asparagine synthase (glutamine-hydrolyzing) n=1 Tax=Cecembia sp. TaxID=1898110 RepID=UPI0025BC35CA|nr:asparagine synthase (glutamine-hydrolyzing) [Cecembia sp.]